MDRKPIVALRDPPAPRLWRVDAAQRSPGEASAELFTASARPPGYVSRARPARLAQDGLCERSAGAGIHLGRTGRAMRKDAVALPLLRRAGLIVDRRSETEIRGWGGRTTYYFKVEFEEGIVGEFRYPGLGAQEDPYATNLPGVAYTRGTELLHFRHIRV